MRIELMLPGLFDRLEAWSHSYSPLPRFVLLERVFAGARRHRDAAGLEASLWQRYDPAWRPGAELPSASTISGIAATTILHATPVHLEVGMQDVILTSPGEVSPQERAQLDTLLNTHFTGDGIQHHLDRFGNGYLAFDTPLAIETTPPSQVAGHGVFGHLPRGDDAPALHRLGNELQMLLHSAPFNSRREQAGLPTINGLWLWGAAKASGEPACSHDLLVSSEPYAQACAAASGQRQIPLPTRFDPAVLEGAGNALIVHPGLMPAAEHDDIHGWTDTLAMLEQDWLQPLHELLHHGKIRQLTITPCNGNRFILSRVSRWKFWRRPKPLAAWL